MKTDIIKDYLDEAEILCQLAEEAAELVKAALKYRRACGYTRNVTPVSMVDAYKNLLEEIADIRVCLNTLGLEEDDVTSEIESIANQKTDRWYKRLAESIGEVED